MMSDNNMENNHQTIGLESQTLKHKFEELWLDSEGIDLKLDSDLWQDDSI